MLALIFCCKIIQTKSKECGIIKKEDYQNEGAKSQKQEQTDKFATVNEETV